MSKIVILLKDYQGGYHFMSHLLFFFNCVYKISCLCWLDQGWYKNLKLQDEPSISKKKLICNVNYIASYAVSYNNIYILSRRLSSLSIIKRVSFISQKAKHNICWYFETMKKFINPAFDAQIAIQQIVIKVAKLRGISFQSKALE